MTQTTLPETCPASVNWERAAPSPVALVFLPWENGGVTICHRDASGQLYGCRDKTRNESFAVCVEAWAKGARQEGLAVEDIAGCLAATDLATKNAIENFIAQWRCA